MKATPIPVQLVLPPPPNPRSVGTHVSSIIRCIAVEMGKLKPETGEEPSLADLRVITDPVAVTRICMGLAWEEWYLHTLIDVEKHPGEFRADGIAMSPDGLEYWTPAKNKIRRVHEVKATYKSTKTVGDMTKEWLWLTQVKAYCKGAKTLLASLHVLFLCGDYQFPIQPVVRRWDLEFSQREIDDNWELIREYRDFREEKT